MGPSRPFRFWGFKHLLIVCGGCKGFLIFYGYIIRCTWIWYDRNRENLLLFYCFVSMICVTAIATNFPWKVFRTYLKDMLTPNLEVCFLLKRGTWGSDPPSNKNVECFYTPKLVEVDAPKRMGHLWRCQRVPSILANLEPTAGEAQSLEAFARISTNWLDTLCEKGGALWWNLTNQATV